MDVPVIDISHLLEPSAPNKPVNTEEALAAQVRAACEQHRFFYISGLDATTLQIASKAVAQMQAFFNHPNRAFMYNYKEMCASVKSKLYRGYTRIGGGDNCVSDSEVPELKESFTVGAEGYASPMHGPNLWPMVAEDSTVKGEGEAFCRSFRQDLTEYFARLLRLSRTVAHALALSLGLPDSFFSSRMTDPVAQLVAFRYPPESSDAGADGRRGKEGSRRRISCGEHTGCGFLTLLVQTAPGLGVFSRATEGWHVVEPVENAILVNLGDLAQFWTKGRYRSTPRRVHNRSPDGSDRYSLVFFANCDFHARLGDLNYDGENGTGRKTQEGESGRVTAGEYILEKLGLTRLQDCPPAANNPLVRHGQLASREADATAR